MREYAIRRALQEKRYMEVVLEAGLGAKAYNWICKFARNQIPNPGSDRVEKLYRYYKLLETKKKRAA